MSEEREQRNKVFGQQKAESHGSTASEHVNAEFGLDIPVELVPLPSCGKTYGVDHPFNELDRVEIRSMTAREEDILTSRALIKKGTVITELIKSCLVNKSVDPLDLLTGDRNALMVAIRITGYGADYDAEIECSACGVKSAHVFNLSEFPIKHLEIEPVAPYTNEFEFVLPRTGRIVRFKFATGRVEEEIMLTQEKLRKMGVQNETNVTTNLLYSVLSISGVEDRQQLSNMIRNLPAMESKALREYIRDNEPGLQMRQNIECPSCDHAEEVSMPIGTNFLWPSIGR